MIEIRATVKDLEQTKKRLEELGCVFDSNYVFKDIIFVPKKDQYNLDSDFIRARVYVKNNWPTKKVVLIRKQTEFKDTGKVGKVILKKEFDSQEEAKTFIDKEFALEFKYGFEFEREGWQYNFKEYRIFLEDIKGYGPSIEIEGNDANQIHSLVNKIGIVRELKTSLSEAMRKILL